MNKMLLLIAISILTGCASMSHGSHQNVTVSPVNTSSTTGTCALRNEEGTWPARPNISTQIDRDGNDMTVECVNDSESGKTVVKPEFYGSYLGLDLLIDLCIISCVVDGANNAFYSYPEFITVPMERKPSVSSATPN
jgi:hypothetical protein